MSECPECAKRSRVVYRGTGYRVILEGVAAVILAALTCYVLVEMFLAGAPQ